MVLDVFIVRDMEVREKVVGGDVMAAVERAKEALLEKMWREVWKECVDMQVEVEVVVRIGGGE